MHVIDKQELWSKLRSPLVQESHALSVALYVFIAILGIFGVFALHGALGINSDATFAGIFLRSNASVSLLLFLSLAGGLMLVVLPRSASRLMLAGFAAALAIAVAGVELRQKYSPAHENSFPKAFSSYHLHNGNLSESLYSGSRLLQGRGNTSGDLDTVPGYINTYRMPGYPILVAIAGLLFRAAPTDLIGLGASVVYFQVFLFALALAAFCYGVCRIISNGLAAVLAVAVCWFPQFFDMTQNDSVILACGLLICASLCVFYSKTSDRATVELKYHLLVHASFAFYFLIRSDIVLGWAGVSLFLYWKKWKYLIIPGLLFLTIGVTWGLYKVAHGSQFVMTTSNVGHVAFVGLWQVPGHKFVWEPKDESYDKWISSHGYKYADPKTNAFAIKEVVRFWFTYPGFVLSNFFYKLYAYFRAGVWNGSLALYPSIGVGIVMRLIVYWLLLLAILTALLLGYEARRTFLLGWPIFLNLPIFCVLQDSGDRFVPFISCSILFAALPLLFETGFYEAIRKNRKRVANVVVFGVAIWFFAGQTSGFLLSDRFRYWAPFLDPSQSTLNVFKNSQ
ncbi:MAG: hypothetical protein HY646_02755 [Acidobacteria bacterium]|nr:hypothetical protein [Acidobacteriota bacterium]